jgi:hypothetical protein
LGGNQGSSHFGHPIVGPTEDFVSFPVTNKKPNAAQLSDPTLLLKKVMTCNNTRFWPVEITASADGYNIRATASLPLYWWLSDGTRVSQLQAQGRPNTLTSW